MVLIVPYGIETLSIPQLILVYDVLIVPYGIETTSGTPEYRRLQQVLIVPYGIETAVRL